MHKHNKINYQTNLAKKGRLKPIKGKYRCNNDTEYEVIILNLQVFLLETNFLLILDMKRTALLLTILASFFMVSPVLAQNKTCGTSDVMEKYWTRSPKIKARYDAAMDNFNAEALRMPPRTSRAVRTIPVVFHVIYNNSSENVPDNVLIAQLQTMTDDFRKMNSDFSNTRSQFQGVAADPEIEFCLASIDPNGNPTTGIVRVPTNKTSWSYSTETHDMKSSSTGGSDGWPFDEYYNIWIVDLDSYSSQSGGTAAYALLPGVGSQWEAIDGTVADYEAVGSTSRTLTHETGHYLGLQHPWGSGSGSCSADDGFTDTPNTNGPTYSCPASQVNCGVLTQWENHMDYSWCPTMFTVEQAAYMNNILNTTYDDSWPGTPGRAALLTSQACSGSTGNLTADFIGTPTSGTPGTNVQFTDQTSGSPTSWIWDFGDGGTSNAQNPSHTYNSVGTYTVTLNVSDGSNNDSRTRTGYIVITQGGSSGQCDTIIAPFVNGSGSGVYVSPGGGWMTGNNYFGDLAKAQAYNLSQPREIPTVIVAFGEREYSSGNSTSAVAVVIYDMDGTGTTTTGTAPCPGTFLGGGLVPISGIVTGTPMILTFQTPVSVSGDYAVAVDFTQLSPGDTVGIYSTVDGDAQGTELAWEQWDDGDWYTLLDAWDLDADLALLPVECPLSITGEEVIMEPLDAILSVYPNPTNGMLNLKYNLPKQSDVVITIYDAVGKEVYSQKDENVTHNTKAIDLSNQSKGVYFVNMVSNEKVIVKKVILSK